MNVAGKEEEKWKEEEVVETGRDEGKTTTARGPDEEGNG